MIASQFSNIALEQHYQQIASSFLHKQVVKALYYPNFNFFSFNWLHAHTCIHMKLMVRVSYLNCNLFLLSPINIFQIIFCVNLNPYDLLMPNLLFLSFNFDLIFHQLHTRLTVFEEYIVFDRITKKVQNSWHLILKKLIL